MISQQLLRVPFYGISPEMEMCEAFAYCYAATQGSAPIPARMQESYLRAWDHDTWEFVPTALAGRPGYVKAYFAGDYRGKVIVAIRGMTSFASLVPIRGGLAASRFAANNVSDFDGHVFDLFSSYAATTYNELTADAAFMNHVWNPLRRPLVLAGFSMGAAVAELLAAKFRRNFPGMVVKLIKFASPKIGTAHWQSNPEVNLPKISMYVKDDPIQAWPFNSIRFPTFASPNFFAPFEPDPHKTIRDFYGHIAGNSVQDFVLFVRQTVQIPLGLPAFGNPWWAHRWETYRYALSSMARRVDANMAARLLHLEFAGDNVWGSRFDYMPDWAPLIAEAAPPPPDVDPGFNGAELRQQEQIRPREARLEIERDASGTSEGGSWGEEEYEADTAGTSDGGSWGGGGGDQTVYSYMQPLNFASPPPTPAAAILRRTRTRRPINPTP